MCPLEVHLHDTTSGSTGTRQSQAAVASRLCPSSTGHVRNAHCGQCCWLPHQQQTPLDCPASICVHMPGGAQSTPLMSTAEGPEDPPLSTPRVVRQPRVLNSCALAPQQQPAACSAGHEAGPSAPGPLIAAHPGDGLPNTSCTHQHTRKYARCSHQQNT